MQHAQQILMAPPFAILVLGECRRQLKTTPRSVVLAERFPKPAPPALALLLSGLALRQVRHVASQHEDVRRNAHTFGNQCQCHDFFLHAWCKHDGRREGQQRRLLARSQSPDRDVLNHCAQLFEVVGRFAADDAEDGRVALG